MKMYPDDWRVRLTTGVTVAICMFAVMIVGPLVGIHGFWPGMIAIVVAIIVGNLVLGPLVVRLFRPSSGSPPDPPPRA